jgi:hypothetical protein
MLSRASFNRWRNYPWSTLGLLLPLILLLPGMGAFPYPSPAARFSDVTITHYPAALYLRQSLFEKGHLPLWSPNILSGMPFAANPLAGVWYPPGWLALMLPLPLGFNLLVAMHLIWGSLGMYRLLRAEGLARISALFGALAFGLMPKLYAHYGAGHLTLLYAVPWTPWLLWAVQARHREDRAPMGFPGEGLILAMILLADVRWSAYAALLWGAYCLANTDLRQWPRRLAGLLGHSLLAVLLAAPLLAPFAELVRLSSRALMGAEDALAFSLPPQRLLGLLFPDLNGFHEYMLYAGQVVLGLTLLLLIRAVRRSRGRFWLWTALFTLLLALGSYLPPLAVLVQFPGLDLLRVPARWLFVAGISLAAAAACALDSLLEPSCRLRPRRGSLVLTALAGFSLALTIGVWIMSGKLAINFALGTAFALASAVWIGLRLGGHLPARAWLAGLLFVAVLEWLAVDRTLFAFRSVESVMSESKAAAEYLSARPGLFRVYSPSYSLPQQTAAMAGLQLADGVDPLQLASYVAYMRPATGVPFTGYSVTLPPFADGDPTTANAAFRPDAALLGRLNVRYVAAEFDLPVEGLQLEAQFGATRLYRNLRAAPRAWLQPLAPSISQELPLPELQMWSPERIEIQAQGPGLLVLSEVAYPGWRVRVDGVPQPLEIVDGPFRAVRLTPGEHEAVFEYRPLSLWLGLAGFGIGAAYLIVVGWRRAATVNMDDDVEVA